MKIFSIVTDWFSSLLGRLSFLEAKAVKAATSFFNEVNGLLPYAEPAVEWVGDVVLVAIKSSHLPYADILAAEIVKIAPGITVDEAKDQAGKLALKDRPDMLLGLAVLWLQYSGYSSVKLRVLRAAIEVAYGIYASKKGI